MIASQVHPLMATPFPARPSLPSRIMCPSKPQIPPLGGWSNMRPGTGIQNLQISVHWCIHGIQQNHERKRPQIPPHETQRMCCKWYPNAEHQMAALWNHLYHGEGWSPEQTLLFSRATEYQTAAFMKWLTLEQINVKVMPPGKKASRQHQNRTSPDFFLNLYLRIRE